MKYLIYNLKTNSIILPNTIPNTLLKDMVNGYTIKKYRINQFLGKILGALYFQYFLNRFSSFLKAQVFIVIIREVLISYL